MKKKPENYLALALDNIADRSALIALVERTRPYFGYYKIGLEQYVRFGPSIVADVRQCGVSIFLDLKLHDIPNTVAKAVKSAGYLGADLLTVHSMGGAEMIAAAVDAAHSAAKPLKIIGVTILTSISEDILSRDLKMPGTPASMAAHLASMGLAAGMDGIVCSAADLTALTGCITDTCEVITPGIRLPGGDTHDQKRIATPRQAIENGATLLVIGRAVTQASQPEAVAEQILTETQAALAECA